MLAAKLKWHVMCLVCRPASTAVTLETVLTFSYVAAMIERKLGRRIFREGNALKVTMFFPLYDNHGDAFGSEIWAWWRENIALLLNGFTDLGVVEGWWQGQSDRNRWIVAVVRTETEVDRIRKFLRSARVTFQQDAMYLDFHGVHFEEIE
jgi:hypothetical protein